MKWAAISLLLVYGAFKVARIISFGRASGYRHEPVSLRKRLLAGEPTLFILAALLAIPPALAVTWYHHHRFSKDFKTSLGCYGRIVAYASAPEIRRTNGEQAVYHSSEDFRATFSTSAYQLGWTASAARLKLQNTVRGFVEEREHADAKLYRARLAQTQHCLREKSDSANS